MLIYAILEYIIGFLEVVISVATLKLLIDLRKDFRVLLTHIIHPNSPTEIETDISKTQEANNQDADAVDMDEIEVIDNINSTTTSTYSNHNHSSGYSEHLLSEESSSTELAITEYKATSPEDMDFAVFSLRERSLNSQKSNIKDE